jgi:ParB-like chromosome segregation protein Spo0J
MKAPQFKRLVENIRRDGVLTQLPLVYRGRILSGNHRVRAAIEAGLTEIEWQDLLGEHS